MAHKLKIKNSELIRGRVGRTNIERCKKNKGFGDDSITYYYREVHHVVCVHCMTDATISEMMENDSDKLQTITDCLDLTKWDINDDHNTVGLPKKSAFYEYKPSQWGGWPCHQVDHNVNGGYTEQVSLFLKVNVWDVVIETAKECEFEPESLEELLKDCSDFWYDFLKTRGGENGGTAYCWKHRFEIADGTHKNKSVKQPWYHPFSMHPDTPTERKPPPDPDAFKNRIKEMLEATFSA
jgi:hypothetical protein